MPPKSATECGEKAIKVREIECIGTRSLLAALLIFWTMFDIMEAGFFVRGSAMMKMCSYCAKWFVQKLMRRMTDYDYNWYCPSCYP